MELNFDKEMDALLRQAARSGEVVSTNPQSHLDADEISAFAENALPEKTRNFYIKHFADCDRCRTILSNTILLNAEAEIETASSVVTSAPEIVETKIPWYRKLFLMPNLAYTMGALVLVFGGIFGFLVLQNISRTGNSELSQIRENETKSGGPNVGNEGIFYNSNSSATASNMMSNSANTAVNPVSNSASNMSSANPSASPQISSADTTASEPQKDNVLSESKIQNQELAKKNAEDDFLSDIEKNKLAKSKEEKFADKDNKTAKSSPDEVIAETTIGAPPPKPMSAQPSITARRTENLPDGAARAKKRDDTKLSARNENTRQISGKTFNRMNGVWIDSAYNPSLGSNMALPPTRTIRRGSSEYRKLDKQVRIIAESLEGAVIIVWKDGAYRIQ